MIKKAFITVLLLAIFLQIHSISAQTTQDSQKSDLQKKIEEYQQKLTETRQQKDTLASQIQYMDTQIYLTQLKTTETEQKIENTQKEIEVLSSRIEGLDSSLTYLSKLMLNRVVEGYKRKNVTVFDILLDSKGAKELMNKFKYFKSAQNYNQKLLLQVQETKLNFEDQKKVREDKKVQLDQLSTLLAQQKIALDGQKAQKQRLLVDTQNDEAMYQKLLARAKAEASAIQGIISGAGTETRLADVKKGDSIASIISGASCNSSGGHVHFIVKDGNSVQNPFSYLKDVDHVNYAGDPWTPSGSMDWPLNPTIQFNQGYGVTDCVRNGFCGRIYSSHDGLDISSNSSDVLAVADGTLYRGSYAVGCTLPYVKLVHKDSSITTLYLHVASNL
ncbi:MAG: hypothetical protein ABIO02_01890 [Patescibacteria group bacterium]